MKYRLLLLLLLLFTQTLPAQILFLRSGAVRPEPNITATAVDSLLQKTPRFGATAFAYLQFESLPSAKEKSLLAANGVALLDYLPDNAFTAAITGSPSAAVLQAAGARSIFQLRPEQKMQDHFARGQIPIWAVQVPGTVDVWISFYKTAEPSLVLAQLRALNVDILSTAHLRYRVVSLRLSPARISELASLPFVEYVQPAPPKDQPLNYNNRVLSRANVLNASTANGGRGLNGEGVTIGHGDNADLQTHADFAGRLINRNAAPFAAHGTHTAATIAGAGNINELYRGYAPKALLLSQNFSSILNNAATYVQDYGMVITNNSYGNIIECEYNGTYDLTSRILDQQALDLPNLVQVFSAGNSGGGTCIPFPTGYHTVLGGYQAAKNVVTVGATTDSGLIAGFSSRGPVTDGRLKPEIVAMGQAVISAWPTNIYSYNNGTSMSAPAVSGGLALLYQRYRQLHGGADPKNGLMKALLCNGSLDRGTAGPDFHYGFGSMNLLRSVEMMEGTRYVNAHVTNSNAATLAITVPANTAQLKVLLYWNDLPASVVSSKSLVNDLDLEVLLPSGAVTKPLIPDTAIAALGNASANGEDHVNNMEQVIINNPVAGSYTIRIKGTTVTTAQQEYFVVYDPVPVQLKLTAPAGGEGLVPGEATKISWESYGLTGNATLEFSGDGGATWVTIDNNIDVNRLMYTWTVPVAASGNAVVRITRNGSGETSVSSPFTITGQPVATLAPVQCEDYIALTWTAVQGATDYEVLLLRGDEMKPVATTTATSFVFSGLSKDTTYFVTVRARVNGRPGRQAVAIPRQPASGTCAGAISNNDVKLDAILSPRSGRKGTSTELAAAETVSIRIKNLDDAPAANFTVSYSINNGTPVTETVAAPVAAGGTYTHAFSAPANLSAAGIYFIKAFVKNTGDTNAANDTATVVVKQIENSPLNLATAFVDNVEPAVPATYERDTLGIAGDDRYDFSRSTAYGRLRTNVNTGIAYSGTKAFTFDVNRFLAAGNTNYLYATFNLSNYSAATADLRLDFRYLNHGQLANTVNRVWIRGSDTQPWIEVYNLDSLGISDGIYKKTGSIELSHLLLANRQNFSSSFGVRWGQWGQWQATEKEAAAGYTIDDIRLYAVQNDVQLLRIESPTEKSCGLSATDKITVTVRNSSHATLTNVPVRYRINSGAFTSETIPSLPAGATVQYSFATTANLAATGTFIVQAVVNLSGDTFRENDTATRTVHNLPVITSFPYLQNFESSDGGFYAEGRRSSWAYGTPGSRRIKGAASGARAWKTNLQGTHNDKELSYLYSPCFDLAGMTAPTLSFSVALDLEDCGAATCDAAWVEYSTDGASWTKLGTANTGTNWYNKAGGRNYWSVQNYSWWHVTTQALPTGPSRLRLRFVMASDPGVSREGIAIDDIHLYDNPNGIYEGPSLTAPVTQTVAGNNWIHFTANNKLVASLQPVNQALGATAVQAYLHNGAVRFTNNQYYLDRNLTIKPSANPADSVLVRLYFLDKETDTLLKATGCPTCAKPSGAYALGVTQYTDADKANENGTLADNEQGLWNFIPASQVLKVPFDKGYYAEFRVDSFSEFWLNSGGPDQQSVLPVKLMTVSATRQSNNVVVAWKVGSETDVLRYEIEVARGAAALQAGRFEKLGEVASPGNSTVSRQYSFTDTEADKFGARYYRLRIVNASGRSFYSPVRAVVFEEAVLWRVYPNPGSGAFSLVFQSTAGERLDGRLYDAKGSLVKEISTAATGFPQKLNIDISANNYATGVYLLRIRAGSTWQVFKLYKR